LAAHNGFAGPVRFFLLAAMLATAADIPAVRFIDIAAQSASPFPTLSAARIRRIPSSRARARAWRSSISMAMARTTFFIANGPPSHSELYKNDGSGHFTEVGGKRV